MGERWEKVEPPVPPGARAPGLHTRGKASVCICSHSLTRVQWRFLGGPWPVVEQTEYGSRDENPAVLE